MIAAEGVEAELRRRGTCLACEMLEVREPKKVLSTAKGGSLGVRTFLFEEGTSILIAHASVAYWTTSRHDTSRISLVEAPFLDHHYSKARNCLGPQRHFHWW